MTALVLGSAASVWEEVVRLEAILGRQWSGPVVACNDMIHLWPRAIDHAVSFHTEKLPTWVAMRGGPQDYDVWFSPDGFDRGAVDGLRRLREIEHWRSKEGGHLSSGGLAAQAALEVADRAVLCGIPLDGQPHAPGSTPERGGGPWPHAATYTEAWAEHKDKLRGRVRSMATGSFTAHLLGEPDLDFLYWG